MAITRDPKAHKVTFLYQHFPELSPKNADEKFSVLEDASKILNLLEEQVATVEATDAKCEPSEFQVEQLNGDENPGLKYIFLDVHSALLTKLESGLNTQRFYSACELISKLVFNMYKDEDYESLKHHIFVQTQPEYISIHVRRKQSLEMESRLNGIVPEIQLFPFDLLKQNLCDLAGIFKLDWRPGIVSPERLQTKFDDLPKDVIFMAATISDICKRLNPNFFLNLQSIFIGNKSVISVDKGMFDFAEKFFALAESPKVQNKLRF